MEGSVGSEHCELHPQLLKFALHVWGCTVHVHTCTHTLHFTNQLSYSLRRVGVRGDVWSIKWSDQYDTTEPEFRLHLFIVADLLFSGVGV